MGQRPRMARGCVCLTPWWVEISRWALWPVGDAETQRVKMGRAERGGDGGCRLGGGCAGGVGAMSTGIYDVDVDGDGSLRFDPKVLERLQAFVNEHPGLSVSAAGNLLVDEALRSSAHPLVGFVDGPSGRRARLAGGPDVDRVIRALVSTQEAEPRLTIDEVLSMVGETSDIPAQAIRAAVEYWVDFPEDIDARIEEGRNAESKAREKWRGARELVE